MNQLNAVWPICYVQDLIRHRAVLPAHFDYGIALELAQGMNPKFAPRCVYCQRVHWFSYKIGTIERAIVSIDTRKMEDFAKRAFDQGNKPIVGAVQPFDNRGIICPRMHTITLDDYYAMMEREGSRGIGGRIIFPGR